MIPVETRSSFSGRKNEINAQRPVGLDQPPLDCSGNWSEQVSSVAIGEQPARAPHHSFEVAETR